MPSLCFFIGSIVIKMFLHFCYKLLPQTKNARSLPFIGTVMKISVTHYFHKQVPFLWFPMAAIIIMTEFPASLFHCCKQGAFLYFLWKPASQNVSHCYYKLQSTLHISKLISNYYYLRVNFLVPENLLWDIGSLRYLELKCNEAQ